MPQSTGVYTTLWAPSGLREAIYKPVWNPLFWPAAGPQCRCALGFQWEWTRARVTCSIGSEFRAGLSTVRRIEETTRRPLHEAKPLWLQTVCSQIFFSFINLYLSITTRIRTFCILWATFLKKKREKSSPLSPAGVQVMGSPGREGGVAWAALP